jgi:hypothetical protein
VKSVRRHAVAAARDVAVDDIDRVLDPASAQMPARALRQKMHDDRQNEHGKVARH